jgi:hypothetical protein
MLSVVTILAIATGTGCITTQKNMPRPLTSAHIAEVKEALDHHGGWVEYDEYGRSELSYLETGSARPDPYLQNSLVLLAEDPPKAIPLHLVRSLWIRDRSVGAVTGLAAGALTGLLSGLVFMAGIDSAFSGWGEPASSRDYTEMALAGGLVGAAIGVIVGVSVGKRTRFTF